MSADRLHRLLTALPDSGLDPELAAWVACGFEAWQSGGNLIEALGLASDLLDRRDELIRMVIPMCPGESGAARFSYFRSCVTGDIQHESQTARQLIRKIQALPVVVPTVRHLRRIMRGRRQDGWCV